MFLCYLIKVVRHQWQFNLVKIKASPSWAISHRLQILFPCRQYNSDCLSPSTGQSPARSLETAYTPNSSAFTECLKYVNSIFMLYLSNVFHRILLPLFVLIMTSFGLTLINSILHCWYTCRMLMSYESAFSGYFMIYPCFIYQTSFTSKKAIALTNQPKKTAPSLIHLH